MHGRFVFSVVFCVAAVCIAYAQGPQSPQPDTAALTELTDEPSRADLFQLIVAAQQPAPQPGQAIPFNLYGPFTFPADAVFDVVENKPRTNSIFGIDISHYTLSSIPLQQLALMKVRYCYAKATQGTSFKDGKFAGFWSGLGQLSGNAAVHRGAYHFLTAAGAGLDQAKTFVKFLNDNGGMKPTDMPAVLDLEWDIVRQGGPDRWVGQDPDAIIQKALDWLKYVGEQTGRTPMLYTARAWWRERIGSEQKFSRFDGYKIWIADYSKSSRAVEVPGVPNGAPAALWQFSESAKLAGGFAGSVDANIYKNTEDKFYSDFNLQRF
jgi:lysozyme